MWPTALPAPRAGPLTGVGQQALQRGPHAVVGQQLVRGLVPQEHAQHGLGLVAMPRVGVPRDAEAQQSLCGRRAQSHLPPGP